MAIDGLAGLARKLAEKYPNGDPLQVQVYEFTLRESKLPELIAAGQAMRSSIKRADNYDSDLRAAEDWREALAAFLAATEGK